MDRFEYGDDKITDKEIMVAVPSIVIGVGVLYLPRVVAADTIAADGWLALLVGGIIIMFFTWLCAKLAVQFPGKQFIDYASLIISKPIAICMTIMLAIQGVLITAFEVRVIGDLAKHYLFDRTPPEVIMLVFLLVVVYAVSGSRAGVLRLNMLFLPIIIFIAIVVMLFTTGWFEKGNLMPFFQTSISGHVSALHTSVLSYLGFFVLLFYISLVKKPKKVPIKAAIGMGVAVFMYMLLFIICIAVFGNHATANLLYPTVELAKEVEIPGGFFERFESVFFVIWIMAIFNTSAMALDVSVFALNSIFKNKPKRKIVFWLSPLILFIAQFPQDFTEVGKLGTLISYYGLGITLSVTILLFIVGKLRGVMDSEKS
ncbi:GerAB/ArcD/ProY family transporter [Virgibacillus siamensis]|uniref:GerAB/ArcD/ProY family transporter n=1 Tax=Virgibacillus siamensis TaxID=480071 RepID=UPI0009864B58|nr:endospore germination permease [Virgibacillus siamensis]